MRLRRELQRLKAARRMKISARNPLAVMVAIG
jgi:hypothetical protein